MGLSQPTTNHSPPKLLDQVRAVIRTKHYSIRTEESYVNWIRRFVIFHKKRHPKDMGENEIGEFLSHLAVQGKVSSSTQNQALCAIVFLYKHILHKEIGELEIAWAKKPKKMPVVFSKSEIQNILQNLTGTNKLMAELLYGTGMRYSECLQLRVKDIDFDYKQITVRSGKGDKDRVTVLPEKLIPVVKKQIGYVKTLHEMDLKNGYTSVYMPFALERKYPNAGLDPGWKFLFPATKISTDPQTGIQRRHHIHESVMQTVQELLGHSDVKTTMIYTHVMNKGGLGVKSPVDSL